MVKVREDLPLDDRGAIDVGRWTERLCSRHSHLDRESIHHAVEVIAGRYPERYLQAGVELAELVAGLNMDTASVLASLWYRLVRGGGVDRGAVNRASGDEARRLLDAVLHMADTSLLEMSNSRLQTSESKDQIGNVRSMLVAMIDDGRVAVLKLAERVAALRAAKQANQERRRRIALEAAEVFAPLAGRLGIWQVKWELEDLALRYLEPDVYMTIARQLDGRREERERKVAAIVAELESMFVARGIRATIEGRAKHIYSIWRKMRTKNVPFDQVYDVLAVRVVVDDLAACYAALGVIHTRWRHIPSEFDDYVACPKENGYRSIHTALIGPDERTFEVQIRTAEMHVEAELGVCSHWWYKDEPGGDPTSAENAYAHKMAWLRSVLDGTLAGGDEALRRELGSRVREERIYVYTPGGHVLDLTTGATVLDFAYRVHTEVGHHCVGARVDGRRVSLSTRLATGQRVHVETSDKQEPQLEWLDPDLGFVRTARARNKIHEWFRVRTAAVREASGRCSFAEMLDALGQARPADTELERVARDRGFEQQAQLFQALGGGDVNLGEIVAALYPPRATAVPSTATIHIDAQNRHGLLRDVAALVSDRELSLVSTTGRIDRATGRAVLTIEIESAGLAQVWALIEGVYQIDGVANVRVAPGATASASEQGEQT